MTTRKLLLVDGSSYLYRAFHALPPLTNSQGTPTGAVLGVLNMLNKLMKEESPERVAVVFDAPGRTFRDDLFDQYKAHRPSMPDDLRSQVQPLLDAVGALGLPMLRIAGVEADDVIGTLAKQAAEAGYDVLISTGDKDMAQLVGPRITLVNTMTNTRLDREGVKAKFDVFPEQIVDYLALVGDSSDNIPGVTGVGPKTAAKWLNQYQTLDSLIVNSASIAGKVGENLRGELPMLELSRKLATIDTAVPLTLNAEELSAGRPDLPRLRELYTRLELRLLLRSLDASAEAIAAPATSAGAPEVPGSTVAPARRREYEKIMTQEALNAWLAKLAAAPLISFDTETDSLDYLRARIVGVSFAVSAGEAAYVPLSHDYPGAPAQLDTGSVLAALKPLLEDEAKPKLGHHLKFDCHILANYGIALAGHRYDSMLESYVLNSVVVGHDMDSTVEKYLGIKTIPYEDVCGKGAKQIPFNQVEIDRAAMYAAEDSDVTLQLHQALWPRLEALPRLKSSAARLADKQQKYRVAMATARCAMSLDQTETVVEALLLLKREFPADPEVLYTSTHFFSELASRSSQELAARAPTSPQAQQLEADVAEVNAFHGPVVQAAGAQGAAVATTVAQDAPGITEIVPVLHGAAEDVFVGVGVGLIYAVRNQADPLLPVPALGLGFGMDIRISLHLELHAARQSAE